MDPEPGQWEGDRAVGLQHMNSLQGPLEKSIQKDTHVLTRKFVIIVFCKYKTNIKPVRLKDVKFYQKAVSPDVTFSFHFLFMSLPK